MNDDIGLWQAILNEPEDDTHRLVYADWLDDHGQEPRAEFIRVQIQRASLPNCGHSSPTADCLRCTLLQREKKLFQEHHRVWFADLPEGDAWSWKFDDNWLMPESARKPGVFIAGLVGGFIGFVDWPFTALIAHGDILRQQQPVRQIQLSDKWPAMVQGNWRWRPVNDTLGTRDSVPTSLLDYLDCEPAWDSSEQALSALSKCCLSFTCDIGTQLGSRLVLTTGEVAKVLCVAPRTVAKWFDSGRLQGYRIPGSQDRRIPRDKLLRFMVEHNTLPPVKMKSADPPAERDVFTAGEVAKLLNVAPRTVSKWFDSGRLQGYRIPGSQDRRIPRKKLERFLAENNMVIEGWQTTADE